MDYEKFSRLYRRRFDEGRIEVWDTIQTYNNKKKKKNQVGHLYWELNNVLRQNQYVIFVWHPES